MKIQLKYLSLLAFVSFFSQISAQFNTKIKFEKLYHDFGEIKEESGKATFSFMFENNSNEVLYIKRIETSCGCTTPEYSKDTLKPGEKGYVKAIYETMGRPGKFSKQLFVYINSSDQHTVLNISGDVIPRPNMNFDKKTYSMEYANLAFNTNTINFGAITKDKKVIKSIKIFNFNGYDIKFLGVGAGEEYIKIIHKDSIVKSMDSIELKLELNSNEMNTPGNDFKRIELLTNDPTTSSKYIFANYQYKIEYSNLSNKELKNAPIIEFNKPLNIDMGTKTLGARFSDTLKVTNSGKSDLEILKIQPNCGCITPRAAKTTLKPGESTIIIFTYDSINQAKAGHKKYVTMFTNDPKKPEITISFTVKLI